ncbi:protein HEAT INTOLERANT 4-like [Impatiens glandulifera]|uniref:protein HEAT INTOLERANT 4-like n=1 Tax=Impatiens glandulifera TaxID=253017 RepID=UPI001FB0638F|nr:protein HEAT INTOLERANT 4-like [Impatiens glandulifera]
MRKGTKRKVSQRDESKSKPEATTTGKEPVENNEEANTSAVEDIYNKEEIKANKPADESRKPVGRVKGIKVKKSEVETEYFPDKRNFEDLWQHAFPVGTEWELLAKVYQYKWDFSNLENEFEEGGELNGKKVYLFGCSEPQFINFKGESKVTYVPAVVAVVSPFPPSDKIGIKSVQRVEEEIVHMKHMKMDWIPYIPLENRYSQVEKLKSQIFILSCEQRRAGLKHLKEDRIKKFEYCLPYLYNPFKEDEVDQETVVDIIFPAEPKPVFCEFDWELDELEEFTDKLIEEEELSEDQKDPFKNFVKEKVREAKRANREAREARKKALEEMSEDKKAAFQNMRLLKFYPVTNPDAPDISDVKAAFINRYYGKAHRVF